MPKLNQIVALVQGKKTRAINLLTQLHRGWAKSAQEGMVRSYKPLKEDGEKFPGESKAVQTSVSDVLKKAATEMAEFFDACLTQESGNCLAKADVTVSGKKLMADVPVSGLLFLDKQIQNIHTFIEGLPTLPTDKAWRWDENKNCYVSEEEITHKTAKVQKPIVLYPATDHHPAQTQLITSDETIGHWHTTNFSGAIPLQNKMAMLERVTRLQEAVKIAREEANSIEVSRVAIGEALFQHVFNG